MQENCLRNRFVIWYILRILSRLLLSPTHIYAFTTWCMDVCTCTPNTYINGCSRNFWMFWIGNKHLYQDTMMRRVDCPWTVQIGRSKHINTHARTHAHTYNNRILQNHRKTIMVFKTINPVKSVFSPESVIYFVAWVNNFVQQQKQQQQQKSSDENAKWKIDINWKIYFMHDNTRLFACISHIRCSLFNMALNANRDIWMDGWMGDWSHYDQ